MTDKDILEEALVEIVEYIDYALASEVEARVILETIKEIIEPFERT